MSWDISQTRPGVINKFLTLLCEVGTSVDHLESWFRTSAVFDALFSGAQIFETRSHI